MSEVWGDIWKGMNNIEFGKEPYMWKFYETLLGDYDFRGKRVLELGCGTGINTVLMSIRGARVTLLDSSREALKLAGRVMERFSQKGEFVHADALNHGFENEFDIVHSEGVIEHFLGRERQQIVEAHARALKKNGMALIIVPNRKSPPYRIGKFISERLGTWMHGEEYPFSRREFESRIKLSGLRIDKMIGGEFVFSFGWMLSPLWLMNSRVLERAIQHPADAGLVKLNYNNFFANRWGRVLGAVCKRV